MLSLHTFRCHPTRNHNLTKDLELYTLGPQLYLGPAVIDLELADRHSDLASGGEIHIDQAKRGYEVAAETDGQMMWYNPFYMNYTPDEEGNFNGQHGYGYISFEKFVDAVMGYKDGKRTLEDLDASGLPTLRNTIATTAILEAGRRSLDACGKGMCIEEGNWSINNSKD